ncbi:MAG: tyrosine-type recombinase/integrase [Chloroflexi bacterium]|nr:tyrosine-type recombinase/integrase [Chloroflexota bacterium]
MSKSLTVTQPKAVTQDADILALVGEWHAALDLQVSAGELSPTSAETYKRGMGKFITWAERRTTVTDEAIREWKAALLSEGHKPGAVNTWLAGVRAFFAWAVGARRLIHNPAASVKGAKRTGTSKAHKRAALTDAEVLRVLAAPDRDTPAGKRDAAMLHLMAYTGARSVEVHRADVGDVRTEGGRLVLAVTGKGRAEADELIVIAHPDAEAALHDWLSARGNDPAGGPLFTSLSNRARDERLSLRAIRGIVKAAYKAAGVVGKNKTTHSLRHTAITTAVKRGAPVQKVQAMARHANISTTMIYYHETDRVENPAEEYIQYNGSGGGMR